MIFLKWIDFTDVPNMRAKRTSYQAVHIEKSIVDVVLCDGDGTCMRIIQQKNDLVL